LAFQIKQHTPQSCVHELDQIAKAESNALKLKRHQSVVVRIRKEVFCKACWHGATWGSDKVEDLGDPARINAIVTSKKCFEREIESNAMLNQKK